MAIIPYHKDRLYIQFQGSTTSKGRKKLHKIVERINHNAEITALIFRSFGISTKKPNNKFQRGNFPSIKHKK